MSARDDYPVNRLSPLSYEAAMDEIDRLRAALDEAQLRSIEASNPGIDMDGVKEYRERKSLVSAIQPPDGFSDTWDLVVDLRQDDWDEANYAARDDLAPLWPSIDFDPETSCFYAYAPSKEDAEEFARALDVWVARRAK